MSARLGYLVVRDGILSIGDPDARGVHLRLLPHGITAYTPTDPLGASSSWDNVRAITPTPPLAQFRPPAWAMLAAAAASASIGIEWQPCVADIPIRIDVETAGMATYVELVCTGFITRGYRRSQCDTIQTALGLLTRDERARALLSTPERFLASLR